MRRKRKKNLNWWVKSRWIWLKRKRSFWNFQDKRSEYPTISGSKSCRNAGTREASLCG